MFHTKRVPVLVNTAAPRQRPALAASVVCVAALAREMGTSSTGLSPRRPLLASQKLALPSILHNHGYPVAVSWVSCWARMTKPFVGFRSKDPPERIQRCLRNSTGSKKPQRWKPTSESGGVLHSPQWRSLTPACVCVMERIDEPSRSPMESDAH